MFEKFLTSNRDDFRQRYRSTFGYFIKDDKKILVSLTGVEDGMVSFTDKDGVAYHLYADAPGNVGFEFIPPKNEFHNTTDGVLLVKRIPQRQFSRGICRNNTYITTMVGQEQRVNFDTLLKIYDSPLSNKEALKLFEDGLLYSVAISSTFAMGYGLIKCFESDIGTYAGRTYSLFDPSLWGVEVSDAMKRIGMEMERV